MQMTINRGKARMHKWGNPKQGQGPYANGDKQGKGPYTNDDQQGQCPYANGAQEIPKQGQGPYDNRGKARMHKARKQTVCICNCKDVDVYDDEWTMAMFVGSCVCSFCPSFAPLAKHSAAKSA